METAEGDYAGTSGAEVADNSLGRLLALCDGVFAIAMTLLALDLRVPELPGTVTNGALLHALGEELPSIYTFLLSFYVVANYWFSHHRLMRSVTATHPRLLRHTLPLLVLVAGLPFPSALLATYGAHPPLAFAIYASVNILASVVLLRLRHDVQKYRLATTPVDPGEWRRSGWELWGNLAGFVVCIPAAFLFGNEGLWALLLLLVSGRGPAAWQWLKRRPPRQAAA
ncbi:TMEM175 family protein [Pseudonocardia sp.]|jgi:uncharacterized membrane protein|uniref:TMEM175 family protein n=1 Tax=Pseudonocardia sp. TaxID=60912 RepID=UPI00261E6ADB|nr:TMEM175 family protein [Pseudonocardia sp.]MCW2717240.1 hypothetical protein [Pseudonocardia sp.]MDT7618987.1 potassium channel family protein [Pseudonocardiales bacterium]